MAQDREGRSNFTLDKEDSALLRALVDRHEARHGFRPSMAQVVTGLIRCAAKESS